MAESLYGGSHMKRSDPFFSSVCALAIPVALQSMLQSSFSIVDQIMIGQLGSVSIAGVGLAGKFSSLYSVVVSAIGAVAGIMISQYLGQKNCGEVRRSFRLNLWLSLVIAALFTGLCALLPRQIMGLYTQDAATRDAAAEYLAILSATYLPMAGATMLSTLLRCTDRPRLPLYASLLAALLNTGLNYILIFGKLGLSPMGARGAGIATAVSQWANFAVMVLMLPKTRTEAAAPGPFHFRQYLAMLMPLLACEVLWCLGENVYAAIYGHLGTDSTAAMTLINPIQGLVIGALCGLSQAAGVLIGKRLGTGEYDDAYRCSRKLMYYGALGSVLLSVLVIAGRNAYAGIYQVEEPVRLLAKQILVAFGIIAPVKVGNMILGGGILRSGGKTKYVMYIDILGTWCFGVPLGLLAAFRWKMSIPNVYFLLSLEECVRYLISLVIFHKKGWMHKLEANTTTKL